MTAPNPDPPGDAACPVCGRVLRSAAGRASHVALATDTAHVAYAWSMKHYARVLRAHPDYFLSLVEELGEEALGLRWLAVRPAVVAWVNANPERVYWLTCRLRRWVRGGLL